MKTMMGDSLMHTMMMGNKEMQHMMMSHMMEMAEKDSTM